LSAPRIALQLYTLREHCELDFKGTLRRVGSLGFDGVEFFELHGHEPTQVRTWLDAAGLAAAGRHAQLETIEERMPELAEELAALGTDRIAISWIEPSSEIVVRIETAAWAAKEAGLRLGFHNHWLELVEFQGGSTFLDVLRDLPSELLWLELDLGWIWYAGADPALELEKTIGRCPLVHVKDFRDRETRDDVPVGEGSVGYERVLPAALRAGAEWLIVEEDEVAEPAFEQVSRSLRAVRRIVAGL
jgi:sugar phosphate isomerase/epimerase